MRFLRRPLILAELRAEKILLVRTDADSSFESFPNIALEDVDGRLIVRAIGSDATDLSGDPGIRVENPFSTFEPLFADIDLTAAALAHAVREVSGEFRVMASAMAMQLPERNSPLSDADLQRLETIAHQIGVRSIYVYVGRRIPPLHPANERTIREAADHLISLAKIR